MDLQQKILKYFILYNLYSSGITNLSTSSYSILSCNSIKSLKSLHLKNKGIILIVHCFRSYHRLPGFT